MEVPFTSKEQDSIVTPEWHCHSRAMFDVEHLFIRETASIPNSNLSFASPGETCCNETILLAHPNDARAFDATVTIGDAYGIPASARIKQANSLVPASRNQNVANGVERETLDCVVMTPEGGLWRFGATKVPKFHEMISGSGGEDVFSGWVEKDLTNPTSGTVDASNGIKVPRYPMLLIPTFEGGGLDFPNHDFTIFTTGGDDRVVEGRPGSVQDSASVASSQWNDIRKPPWKAPWGRTKWIWKRENRERPSARGVPVQAEETLREIIDKDKSHSTSDGKTYARRSDQVGIPGTGRNFNIVYGELFLRGLAKHMAADADQ